MGRCLAFLTVFAASDSVAATWHVAQDGSGDFDNLISASEAVASGDTVFVAAGVYDSTTSFVGLAGSRTTCFPVPVADLTIIGEGQADVVIGPQDVTQTTSAGPFAIYGIDGATSIRLSGVTVRNSWVGLNTRAGGSVTDSRFYMNETGILDSGTSALIVSSCQFEENNDGYFALGCSFPKISGSTFVGGQRRGINFLGAIGGVVVDCDFPGGRVGIQFQQGSTNGQVSNCTFGVLESISIVLVSFSSAQVSNCFIPGSLWRTPIQVESYSSLLMTNCFIGDGADGWSIDTQSPVTLEVRQCDILPGTGFAIKLHSPGIAPSIINMPLNYWGTTDPLAIQDLIWDASDDSTTMATVIYEPFANQPVPNQEDTVGGIKGMFRSPGATTSAAEVKKK